MWLWLGEADHENPLARVDQTTRNVEPIVAMATAMQHLELLWRCQGCLHWLPWILLNLCLLVNYRLSGSEHVAISQIVCTCVCVYFFFFLYESLMSTSVSIRDWSPSNLMLCMRMHACVRMSKTIHVIFMAPVVCKYFPPYRIVYP